MFSACRKAAKGKGNNRRRSYMHFPGGLNDAIRSTRYMLAHEELFPDQDIARRLYRSACQEVVEMGSQIMIVGNNDRDEDKVGIVGSVAAWKQAMRTVSAFSAYRFRNVADIIDAILGGELNVARGIDLCRANLSLVECEPFLGFANYIRSELGCVTHATVEGAINILEEVERECKFFAAKQGLEQSCAVLGEVRDRLRRKDAWAQSVAAASADIVALAGFDVVHIGETVTDPGSTASVTDSGLFEVRSIAR